MPDEEALLHRPRGRQRRWTLRYRPGNPEADAQIGRLAAEADLPEVQSSLQRKSSLFYLGNHKNKKAQLSPHDGNCTFISALIRSAELPFF